MSVLAQAPEDLRCPDPRRMVSRISACRGGAAGNWSRCCRMGHVAKGRSAFEDRVGAGSIAAAAFAAICCWSGSARCGYSSQVDLNHRGARGLAATLMRGRSR
jgi:hypothetical protein